VNYAVHNNARRFIHPTSQTRFLRLLASSDAASGMLFTRPYAADKSSDLSLASQMFYKQAKKQNQCCAIM